MADYHKKQTFYVMHDENWDWRVFYCSPSDAQQRKVINCVFLGGTFPCNPEGLVEAINAICAQKSRVAELQIILLHEGDFDCPRAVQASFNYANLAGKIHEWDYTVFKEENCGSTGKTGWNAAKRRFMKSLKTEEGEKWIQVIMHNAVQLGCPGKTVEEALFLSLSLRKLCKDGQLRFFPSGKIAERDEEVKQDPFTQMVTKDAERSMQRMDIN